MKKSIKLILKRILSGFNFILIIKISGKRFKIPILGNLGTQNVFTSEKWMIDLLKIIIQIDSNKFIDIGVNTGQTLLKIRSIDNQIKYIGFEPNSSCIHYVKRLIKVNSLKNVTLLPIGVSFKTGLGILNFYHENDGDSSASMIRDLRNNKVVHKDYISLFNISDLKDDIELSGMSILKIDVEGAELEVIQSFRKEIEISKPFIIMEILPIYDKTKNGDRYERQVQIHAELDDLNYSILRIVKTEKKLIRIEEIKNIGIHSDLNNCDYLCVHKTKLNMFKTISKY